MQSRELHKQTLETNSYWEYMLACIQNTLDTRAHHPPLPSDTLSGTALLKLAEKHRVASFLMESPALENFTEELKNPLVGRVRGLARHAAIQIDELQHIQVLFEKAHIRWLSFKGPCLAAQIYGNPSLRPGDDLDLIVHPDDLEQALRLLQDNGYHDEQRLSAGALKEIIRGNWGRDFRSPNHNLLIEIKTDIAPKFFSVAVQNLIPWDDRPTITLDQVAVPVLPPHLNLIALCAHGGWHHWERLLWIIDIGLLAQHESLDPKLLTATAKATGTQRLVQLGLSLVEETLNLNIKKELTDKSDSALPLLVHRTTTLMNQPPLKSKTLFSYHLSCRERLTDKVRYVWRLATYSSDGDWKSLTLPRWFAVGYRIARPFRLLKRIVSR